MMKTQKNGCKWESIFRVLKNEILSGNFNKGDKFITSGEISARFNVSNIVARRVLHELSIEGLIDTKPGYGAVISRPSSIKEIIFSVPESAKNSDLSFFPIFKIINSVKQKASKLGLEVKFVSEPEIFSDSGRVIFVLYDFFAELRKQIEKINGVIVLLHCPKRIKGFHTVRHGLFEGACIATKHLIEKGYRRIGFIGALKYDWYIPRFQGFLEALKEFSIGLNLKWVKESSGHDKSENWKVFQELIEDKNRPDAIFCANDSRAIDILEYCQMKKIRVPQEIAICGLDNIDDSQFSVPPLTTVDTKLDRLGEEAILLGMKIMEGEIKESCDIVIEPELIVREST